MKIWKILKWLGLGFGCVLLMGYGFLWFHGRYIAPYFVDKQTSVGAEQLRLYGFQPFVLRVFESKGKLIVSVVYLQRNGIPGIVKVWLMGGNTSEITLGAVPFVEKLGDKSVVRQLDSLFLARRYLKLGNRVYFEYFGGDSINMNLLKSPMDEVCVEAVRMCLIHGYVSGKTEFFSRFTREGVLDGNNELPALGISRNLSK